MLWMQRFLDPPGTRGRRVEVVDAVETGPLDDGYQLRVEGCRWGDAEPDPEGFRDYTLYAIDVPGRVLLPIVPVARLCAHCGRRVELSLPRFGDGVLLDLDEPICTCGAKADLARDRAELRNGAVFLLEELACRAALSIELPRPPQSEELPDAQVAQLIREALGGTDELADDGVPPAE